MNTYTPDRWVLIEIDRGHKKTRKILSGWYGGYTDSDKWRLSSGITSSQEFDDRFEFTNYSGSKYICMKDSYGMSSYTASVYESFVNGAADIIHLLTEEEAFSKERANE